ncbi:MAG: NAD-dependent epimerase/dehydratase family protein, partial [Rhabdochlamydiaceae bacterium]
MEDLTVYGGTGFVGRNYLKHYSAIKQPRYKILSDTANILYCISTVDNYNIFDDPHLDINTNLNFLIDVLELWRKHTINGCFNFLSSWFVYNDRFGASCPASEVDPCNPKGFYSVTKLAAEGLLRSYCETYNLKYRILRLSSVLGPDASFSPKKNALQYLIDEMAHDRDIKLYNWGYFYRNFIHVNDCVNAIELIMNKGDKNIIYNIGSKRSTLFANAITYARGGLHSKSRISNMSPSDFHKVVQIEDFHMNTNRLRSLGFGYQYDDTESIVWDILKTKYLNGEREQFNNNQ